MMTFTDLAKKIAEKSYGLFTNLSEEHEVMILNYLLDEIDQTVLKEEDEMEWDYEGYVEVTELCEDHTVDVRGMFHVQKPDDILQYALQSTLKTEDELADFILINLYNQILLSTERSCLMPMGLLKGRLIQDVYNDCVKQCKRDPAKLVLEIVDKTYKWMKFQITGQLSSLTSAGYNPVNNKSSGRDLVDEEGTIIMNLDLIGSVKMFPNLLLAVYGTSMLRSVKKGLTWDAVLKCMQHNANPMKEFDLTEYHADKTQAKINLMH